MNLTLIRHGQAGTRMAYDALSTTGKLQSKLLGQYLQSAGAGFEVWKSGGLLRQRETASIAGGEQLSDVPVMEADAQWNEFDLDGVYQGLAPRLAAANSEFRTHWETVQEQVTLHGHKEDAAVNRRWSPADEMVMRAWVGGQMEYEGESWQGFRERIRGALRNVAETGSGGGSTVVFTSATPAAICVGEALGLPDPEIFHLAGALMNTSITELRWRGGRWRMFSFNNVPHLSEVAMRTHR